MPELPEVETVCRTLRRHVVGERIAEIDVRQPSLRWPVDVPQLHRLAVGNIISAVRRRAKYILLDVHNDRDGQPPAVLAVHLGMSGILRVTPSAVPLRAHDHVMINLAARPWQVRYNDPRRFGSMHIFARAFEPQHALFAHLGIDPIEDANFCGEHLFAHTHNSERAIKQVIMDARVVVGVGNIYASEALWRSGISPRTTARRLSLARLDRLARAIVFTLQDAIEQGGTTLRDFSDADAAAGHFAQRLQVYGRDGSPCFVCAKTVRKITQGARSSYFCSGCQRA